MENAKSGFIELNKSYIKAQSENIQPIYFRKVSIYKFKVNRLMSMIDQDKLASLAKEFQEHPNGLSKNEFIEYY